MRQTTLFCALWCAWCCIFSISSYGQAPFLSQLKAGKDFPIYTTYAAPMERADYLLDEAYKFRFYVDSLGADFISDNGGDIGLAFQLDGKLVYRVKDMFRAPVITASYPDIVRYEMYPFEGIKAVCTFLTYHSHLCMMEVRLFNEGSYFIEVEVMPFIKNRTGFAAVKRSNDYRQLGFIHEEYPDEWMMEHKIPYVDTIKNLFGIREEPDGIGVFNSVHGEAPFPARVRIDKKPMLPVKGQIYLPGKAQPRDDQPAMRVQLTHDYNQDTILTERSGQLGDAVNTDGSFLFDAGLLGRMDGGFKVSGLHLPSGEIGYTSVEIKDGVLPYAMLQLGEGRLPPLVEGITFEESLDGQHIIRWRSLNPEIKYSVYQRVYPSPLYVRIAKDIQGDSLMLDFRKIGRTVGYVVAAQSRTGMVGLQSEEVTNIPTFTFDAFVSDPDRWVGKDIVGQQPKWITDGATRMMMFFKRVTLPPGQPQIVRTYRLATPVVGSHDTLLARMYQILAVDWQSFITENERRTAHVKAPEGLSNDQQALFWSNVNMMRQSFFRPLGLCKQPFYVFSREPKWGWGHSGQVFHESLTMLSYASIDPMVAMGSQRIFADRQRSDGYINYRTGPFLNETIEAGGQPTMSAPWYAWTNFEIYRKTKDKAFLKEMYASSKAFYNYLVTNRDSDNDGLCEWGGNGILESVRDSEVAIWDQVAPPKDLEALDLNCMLVKEAKSLELMANELGNSSEAATWKTDYTNRAELINRLCWSNGKGFYYHVNKQNHGFTITAENDLQRDEIIGFLPLWAGICNPEQAESLRKQVADPYKFLRQYGLPTLSASDPYYNPKGYWNGPNWVQWSYLVTRGLRDYNFHSEANTITQRTATGMIETLRQTHDLWEFYSPDHIWGGHHKTYIWAGLINKMLEEVQ